MFSHAASYQKSAAIPPPHQPSPAVRQPFDISTSSMQACSGIGSASATPPQGGSDRSGNEGRMPSFPIKARRPPCHPLTSRPYSICRGLPAAPVCVRATRTGRQYAAQAGNPCGCPLFGRFRFPFVSSCADGFPGLLPLSFRRGGLPAEQVSACLPFQRDRQAQAGRGERSALTSTDWALIQADG